MRAVGERKANPGHCLWGQSDGESGSVLRPGQVAAQVFLVFRQDVSGNKGLR